MTDTEQQLRDVINQLNFNRAQWDDVAKVSKICTATIRNIVDGGNPTFKTVSKLEKAMKKLGLWRK